MRSLTTRSLTRSACSGSTAARAVDIVCWDTIAEEAASGGGWPAWLQAELRSDHAGETGAVWIYRGALAAMRVRSRLSARWTNATGLATGCPYASLEAQPAYHFAQEHMATESEHLEAMEKLVPPPERSRLIPMWKLAGGALGAIPVLASPYSPVLFFSTINAVETFVEEHYLGHIRPLEDGLRLAQRLGSEGERVVAASAERAGPYPELLKLLRHCNADEVHHKEEAALMASVEGLVYGEGKSAETDPWLSNPGKRLTSLWMRVVRRGSEIAVVFAKRF